MLALIVAASIFSAFARDTFLVSALPQLRSSKELLAAIANSPQFINEADEIAWDLQLRSRHQSPLTLALRGFLRERAGDLAGAIADLEQLERVCGANEWSMEYLTHCRRLHSIQIKQLEWLLAVVRISPGKFITTYREAAGECDNHTRTMLIHLLNRKLTRSPNDDSAHCLRGLLHHIDGRWQLAITDYKAYAWNHPRDLKIHLLLVSAQTRLKNFLGALSSARDAVQAAPMSGAAHRALASALMLANRYDEAISAATRAIILNSDPAPDYIVRGLCLAYSREFGRAVSDLSRAMEDEDWQLFGNYARCLTRIANNDLDGALTDAESLVRRMPDETAFRIRGLVHGIRGENLASLSDTVQSIKASDNVPNGKIETRNQKQPKEGLFSSQFHLRTEVFFTHEQVVETQLRIALAHLLIAERSAASAGLRSLTKLEKSSRLGRFVQCFHFATNGDFTVAISTFREMLFPPPLQDSTLLLTGGVEQSETKKPAAEESRFSFTETKSENEKEDKKPSTTFLDRNTLTEVMTEKEGRTPTLTPVVGVPARREETPPVKRKGN